MRIAGVELLALQLEVHPGFRVVWRAAIVDTETTGTDHAVDKVIELAVVVF